MKHYGTSALIYAVLAMIGGVFYREFTKHLGYVGDTTLAVVHTHYFALGVLFMLIIALIQRHFNFHRPFTAKALLAYHLGLNITCLMLLIRGIAQVKNLNLSSTHTHLIAGFSGIGHMLLGISMLFFLWQIRQAFSHDEPKA